MCSSRVPRSCRLRPGSRAKIWVHRPSVSSVLLRAGLGLSPAVLLTKRVSSRGGPGCQSVTCKCMTRMEGKLSHAVPVTPILAALLERRRDAKARPYLVFSSTGGIRPFSGFSEARHLRSRSPSCGWQLHDLRRTRIPMSRANMGTDISERVFAHALPGIQGVYDQWAYCPRNSTLSPSLPR
jgi:hypothetical protein